MEILPSVWWIALGDDLGLTLVTLDKAGLDWEAAAGGDPPRGSSLGGGTVLGVAHTLQFPTPGLSELSSESEL